MLRSFALYTAMFLGANLATPVVAGDGLEKLVVTSPAPVAGADLVLDNKTTQTPVRLADYRGKPVVLNLWATWCAPCREEMPSLDALAKEAGEDLVVLPVASGRNTEAGVAKFFAESGVQNLPVVLDPKQQLARALGVRGLPVTILIDRDGREVARLLGGADWASDAAKAKINDLTAPAP